MLIGTAAVTIHLLMVDCPVDKPNDPACIQVVAMDIYGPIKEATQLCELNAKFLNPNIDQIKGRFMEAQCWKPAQLKRLKTVL